MQIPCLKSTDLNLIILAKNSVLGRGGQCLKGSFCLAFFFFFFLLFIFLKSLASNNILLAIQMLRFSVFHIIKLDNSAASGISQANSKSYGVLQNPSLFF